MLKEDGTLDIRIHKGRYQLQRKLGRGSFGVVYQATDLVTGDDVAIKLEHSESGDGQLQVEADIYQQLRGHQAYQKCTAGSSTPTNTSKKYVHRDIKPENILKGIGKKGNDFYITDIGLGEEQETKTWKDDDWPGHGRVIGTVRYASKRVHAGKELSPRDDLESLGYVLVYLLRGTLPWQGLKAGEGESIETLVGTKKSDTPVQDLCAGLPLEFALYFEHLAGVPHRGKPDYVYLCRLFRNAFASEGFEYDHVFDWTALKFMSSLEEKEAE